MRLFFDMNKKSLPQVVKQNESDIKELKKTIKPIYTTSEQLTTESVVVDLASTNIDVDKFDSGFLLTEDGELFDIVSIKDDVVYISFMADFKVIQEYLSTFNFVPDIHGVLYAEDKMTINGKLTYTLSDGENNATTTRTIDAVIQIPISGSDDIIVDANEDSNAIELHIDNALKNRIARALVVPVSIPPSTELVGIDSTNAQVGIAIGEGLTLDGNTLKSTGGSGGGGGVVVETYTLSQLQSLYNKLLTLYQNDKSKILKLSIINKGTNDWTLQINATELSSTESSQTTKDIVIVQKDYTDFYPSENQFWFQRNNSTNTLIRFTIVSGGNIESITAYYCSPRSGKIVYGSGTQNSLNKSSHDFEFKLYYFE